MMQRLLSPITRGEPGADEPKPDQPRTDNGRCPDCGGTAINVQGLLDCPECRFRG